jgi:hypothetical protein
MLSGREILQAYTPSLDYDSYHAIFSPDGKKLITVDTDLKTNLRRFHCRDLTAKKELWNLVPRPQWSYVNVMLAYSPTDDIIFGLTDGTPRRVRYMNNVS